MTSLESVEVGDAGNPNSLFKGSATVVVTGQTYDELIEVGSSDPSRLSNFHRPKIRGVQELVDAGSTDIQNDCNTLRSQKDFVGVGQWLYGMSDNFAVENLWDDGEVSFSLVKASGQ
jgi:hypothetical protein